MSVQEMSINGDQPPPEYIVKESKFGSIDSFPPLADQIPIIDISLFSQSSLAYSKQAEDHELEKLRSALSSAGCFQGSTLQLDIVNGHICWLGSDWIRFGSRYVEAIGHGISDSFLDKVREAAKHFFALPVEEKEKYSREINGGFEGYGNDFIVSEKQVLDWSYRLILRVFPVDQRTLHLWPQIPSDFGEMLHEYATKIKLVMGVVFKAMAKSLNLDENSFAKKLFGEQAPMHARFNFYPPCSRSDLVLGVKAHTDGTGITLLLQDKDVEGLQVLIDDKWVRVPIVPHAILLNLGDQMQIMSNGIYKSPLHRAVTNPERMRMSVALFNEPDPETEIGPVENLVDDTRPRLYKNVKNYGLINYECYQRGEIALETVRI